VYVLEQFFQGDALTDEVVKVSRLVTGRVKWYDAEKGYGFVTPADAGPDVMVHVQCVRAAGLSDLAEGGVVSMVVVRGERGLQATELVSVIEAADPAPDRSDRPTEIAARAAPEGDFVPARVKWFNKQKGFGFVNVFRSADDIFVHMETLRKFGMGDLQPGEAVCVRLVTGPRGAMAGEICRWEDLFET
jgi:CspA family cold shock protein